jgi:flagellar biosynthesis/type III secretory pathway protein FliH
MTEITTEESELIKQFMRTAKNIGYNEGKQDGYKHGFDDGYDQGYREGVMDSEEG